MEGSEININRIIHILPDFRLGHVHALLHHAAGLKLRLPEGADLGQYRLKVLGYAVAVLLRHVVGQRRVGFVLDSEQCDDFRSCQFLDHS